MIEHLEPEFDLWDADKHEPPDKPDVTLDEHPEEHPDVPIDEQPSEQDAPTSMPKKRVKTTGGSFN